MPFCQGEEGSQNQIWVPVSAGQFINSEPRSKACLIGQVFDGPNDLAHHWLRTLIRVLQDYCEAADAFAQRGDVGLSKGNPP